MGDDITLASLGLGYRGASAASVERYVPLGPLYLVSALERAGFRVDFRDLQTRAVKRHSMEDSSFSVFSGDGGLLEDMAAFLENPAPVLGFSCMSDLLPLAVLAAELVKERWPRTTIVMGGIGPTGVASRLLSYFPFLDMVALGEGEETVVDAMRCIERDGDLMDVGGLMFRRGRRILRTPSRPFIHEVDSIAPPAYHRVDMSDYTVPGILTSRGCPFDCLFCDVSPFWGRRSRARSIGGVMEEIRLLRRQYGVEYVDLVDDTFTLDKGRVLEFCGAMEGEMPGMTWSCCARVDGIDEEMMKAMARGGCRSVAFGVESGSDRVLERLGKGVRTGEILTVLSRSLNYFPEVLAYFSWGYPFENMTDFRDTVDFIFRVRSMGVQPWVFSLSPLPLSRLYRDFRNSLMFSEEYCSNYLGIYRRPQVVELVRSYPEVFPGFYYCDPRFPLKFSLARDMGLWGMPS